MRRAIVVLSGGQDSTTCLFHAIKHYDEVHAVTFDYGQRHRREIDAARFVAQLAGAGLTHELIVVPDILQGTSPLVNKESELEQYKDHHSLPGGLEKTFVPMRNQFFLTVAANRAIVQNCDVLVTGVCQEDYGGYPDCRRVFIDALENAIRLGTAVDEHDRFAEFEIDTPLMDLSKADSVQMALDLKGCYGALGFSHTSYDGKYPPTGKDHATLLRAKGFEEAGVPDPLVVRAYWEGHMPLPETENYTEFKDAISNWSPWAPGVTPTPVDPSLNPRLDYIRELAERLERMVHGQ